MDEDKESQRGRERLGVQLMVLTVEGGMVALAILMGWLFNRPLQSFLVWSLWDALLGVGLSLPLIAVVLILMRWPIGPFAKIKSFTLDTICTLLAPCSFLDLVCIAFLAGLGEEMLFRGALQSLLGTLVGPIAGLLLASAIFGFLHFITLTYALFAMMGGLYLGWIFQWRGNLLAPIFCHTLYDLVLLWYLLYGPGMPASLLEDSPTTSPK